MIGRTLSHYKVLEELSRGGMGIVYRALDVKLNREVALKVLPAELVADPERKRRFVQEAQAAAALDHPHIAVVFEIDEADGVTFIAMELIRGPKLRDVLQAERLPLGRALELATEVAEGLARAHDKGIVHRDLKSANIMVTEDRHAKIIDFGLAKLVEPLAGDRSEVETALHGETDPGKVMGTVSYMSPEQARGAKVDHRSDIFSFGAVLYEMLSGRLPFQRASGVETLSAILKDSTPRLPAPGSEVPAEAAFELQRMVDKCLAKDPADRYQTMKDVVVDLRSARRRIESDISISGSIRPVTEGIGVRRRLLLHGGGMTALLIVLVLAALLFLRGRTAPPPADSLGVMYFENLADPQDSDNLGRMLTGLLTTELSRHEGLKVMSSQKLHDVARQLGESDEGTVDRNVASEVARRAGLGTMVLGQVTRAGERLMVITELVEVATGRLVGSQKAEGKTVEDIFSIAESLGEQVRGTLRRPSAAALEKGDLARELTDSVEAYRAYVRGETLLHRQDFKGATEQFRESVRLDPGFALAHYRLSLAAGWLGTAGSLAAAEKAASLVERLPASYRDVAQANSLYRAGHYARAIPILESALSRDPENKEALYLLSEMYFHSSRDNDAGRARELMEKLLDLDPSFHLVYHHLASVYIAQGEKAKARESFDRWESEEPSVVQEARTWLLVTEGRIEEALRMSEGLAEPLSRAEVAILASRWDVAREALFAKEDTSEGYLRSFLLRDRGHFHVYRGELNLAAEAYRAASVVNPDDANDGVQAGTRAAALHELAELLSLKGDSKGARAAAERALEIQPQSLRCLYYSGRFALISGDFAAPRERLATLTKILSEARTSVGFLYRDGLEAEIALASGRPAEALPLFERVVGSGKLLLDGGSTASFVGAAFRDGLARTLLELGRKQEAAQALEALLQGGYERLSYPALYVRALYTLGVLKTELGDREKGRQYLERFLEHWGRADWDLAEVRDARRRLTSK